MTKHACLTAAQAQQAVFDHQALVFNAIAVLVIVVLAWWSACLWHRCDEEPKA